MDNTSKPSNTGSKPVFVYVLATFATVGGLLFGYDIGIVSGSMLLIQPYFDLDTLWQELIVSGTIAAAAVFALCAGFIADYIGRKKTIMVASVIFVFGSIIMGAAPSKQVLLTGRVVVGFGVGFASVTIPVYVAESSPVDIRGRLVTLNQLMITIGILLSSIIAGLFSSVEDTGWRYMLALAGIPGVVQFVGFFFLPESPRWLVDKGRDDEARDVLVKIRGNNDVEEELDQIKLSVRESKESDPGGQPTIIRVLRTPFVRKALFIGAGLSLFQQLSGINTVIYYSGTILKMAGFPVRHAIWLVVVPNTVNFLATFIGLWAVERFGRRRLLVYSIAGVILSLITLAVGFQLSTIYSPVVNQTLVEAGINGTRIQQCYSQYTKCEDCVQDSDCGFCYENLAMASCLPFKDEENSLVGRCYASSNKSSPYTWTHGYCPNDFTWISVLGMTLFVFAFAPGLGPMPWTINSEIYPLWARSTCNSISVATVWICNLIVSMTFLTLTETITKYGTFWMFSGISTLGLVFVLIFLPETKNKSLEEVEELFMTETEKEDRQRKTEENVQSDMS